MYNNEVTYDEKWNTKENKNYQKKLMDFLRPRSRCCSHVPVSWSKEVYEFIMSLHDRYGIGYTTDTYNGYFVENNLYILFIKKPLQSLFYTTPEWLRSRNKKPWYKKVLRNIRMFFESYQYGFKVFFRHIFARIEQKFYNRQIVLDQFKEKFGSIRFYYNAPEHIENIIEKELIELEIKLSRKGAYYSLEELAKWSRTVYNEDNDVTTFPYKEYLEGEQGGAKRTSKHTDVSKSN